MAWDPVTQKERWRITGPGVGGYIGRGTLVTGGNLVFHGNAAYNATTGEKLWESDMADRSVTPISYRLDGKQYVSVVAAGRERAGVYVRAGWEGDNAGCTCRHTGTRTRAACRARPASMKPPRQLVC